MSADRELLELAAKAYWAGEIDDVVSVEWNDESQSIIYTHPSNQDHNGNDWALLWNPLTDDGDALRLAVKLGLDVDHFGNSEVVEAWVVGIQPCAVEYNSDRYAATRRAIVRAAAEIGKAMP